MNEKQIFKLKIDQLVKVKCKEPIEGFFIAKVKSINDWTKLIGVVDSNGHFKWYPYRLIISSFSDELLSSDVMTMLQHDNVLQKAHEYLDGESTDGQTTMAEKQMFVQGFLQACSWIRENYN